MPHLADPGDAATLASTSGREPGIRTVARTVRPSPLAIVRRPVRLLAMYTRAPSDETARPVGSMPTGSVACTVWPATSTIERLGPPRLVVYPRRPSGERAKRYGPGPTLIVAVTFWLATSISSIVPVVQYSW